MASTSSRRKVRSEDLQQIFETFGSDSELSDLSDLDDDSSDPSYQVDDILEDNGDTADDDESSGHIDDAIEAVVVASRNRLGLTTTQTLADSDDEMIGSTNAKKKKADYHWIRRPFVHDAVEFQGLTEDLDGEPLSGIEYFLKYFSPDFIRSTIYHTEAYSVEQNGNPLKISDKELLAFIGIHLLIGVRRYPRISMYWAAATRVEGIAEAMDRKRFHRIRNCLHFCGSSAEPENVSRLWKIEPLIQTVRNRCRQLTLERNLSIDEQMIPFKGKTVLKQYIQSKPRPWGVKNFVLCGVSGLVYDFEIYQGKGTQMHEEFKYLGLGGGIVMRLVENVPRNVGHSTTFDNFFTSVQLLEVLQKEGIVATGTIRGNRVTTNMTTEKDLKEKGRGSYDFRVERETGIVIVRWLDNGVVQLVSSSHGPEPVGKVLRWCAKENKKVEVTRPEIVKHYNETMGGVDKIDFLISLYRIEVKSRKWTLKIFQHMLDLACCNSWLEYKRDCAAKNVPKKQQADLLKFRFDIANDLLLGYQQSTPSGTPTSLLRKTRGRPRLSDLDIDQDADCPPPKRRLVGKPTYRPDNALRHDGFNHLPVFIDKHSADRCKLEGCSGKSRVQCKKCKVALCGPSAAKNCFLEFHEK